MLDRGLDFDSGFGLTVDLTVDLGLIVVSKGTISYNDLSSDTGVLLSCEECRVVGYSSGVPGVARSPSGWFSYSNTTADYFLTGNLRTAQDSHTFLIKWFQRFSQNGWL